MTYLHVVHPVLTFGPQALAFLLEARPVKSLGIFMYNIYAIISNGCLEVDRADIEADGADLRESK